MNDLASRDRCWGGHWPFALFLLFYSAVTMNVLRGCAIAVLNLETSDHVYLDSRVEYSYCIWTDCQGAEKREKYRKGKEGKTLTLVWRVINLLALSSSMPQGRLACVLQSIGISEVKCMDTSFLKVA